MSDKTVQTSSPASQQMGVRGMSNLLEALFTKGLISNDELRSVKFESITSNVSPEQLVISKGLVAEDDVQHVKSEMYAIGFVDLTQVVIDTETLNLLPEEVARRSKSVVFERTNSRVKVAMVDPLDLQNIKYLESVVKNRVDAYFATEGAISRIIDTRYGAQVGEEVTLALEDVGVLDLGRSEITDLTKSVDSAPVSKIVNMILDYAVKHHASDVHVEPRDGKISVRYRIFGILSEKLTLPAKLGPAVVSRIKILANMKIDEHRVPQDNRFQVKSGGKIVDLRVSVMPSIYGEKVVMRLLEKDNSVLDLRLTGMRGPGLQLYMDSLAKTQGIILITGPTGSGKTQTLASSLSILNKPEVNILTIEDPVEIRVDGVTQVQVNTAVGLTFATALRSFLRQDPDIIMVGEIRDSETANLAVQAALTGHLVLATLHTNSAAGALPRLMDMGVQPFLLASTINVIVAQRLVRKLCDACKHQVDATSTDLDLLHEGLDVLGGVDVLAKPSGEQVHFASDSQQAKLYQPVGCPKCSDSGYSGRIGIFEILGMSEKIGQMVMTRVSTGEIERQAIEDGMLTMAQDGLIKALEGLTTVEEVLRVQNS